MRSFNLVEEKWIPCVMHDGELKDFGLQEVLICADEINELKAFSPLVTISLHRLLLSILHRNFGPTNISEWEKLWNHKKWDEKIIKAYFATWNHRFNLFDEKRPFYQSAEVNSAERHPIFHLALESATGNNATLFDHNSDGNPILMSRARAAHYLIAAQSYSIGFGKSFPFYLSDTPLIRGITTLALGNSLFETLALNLIIYNKERPFPHIGTDLPVWEQEVMDEPNSNGSPIHGYLDYLTWQSRHIHLFPSDDFSVGTCQIQQNLKLPKQTYLDPFKGFHTDTEKGIYPIAINLNKAIWRDSHVLFQTSSGEFKRPEIMNWLARIDNSRRSGAIQAQSAYKMMVTGLATDTGKAASIMLWRQERLPLPLAYLVEENQCLLGALKDALSLAEEVGRLLNPGFIKIEKADKKGKIFDKSDPSPLRDLARLVLFPDKDERALNIEQKKEIVQLIESLSPARPYWVQLGISFNRLLVKLPEDKIDDEYGKKVLPWWAKEIQHAALDAFNEASNSFDRTGRMLKAVTIAEKEFKYHLFEILKPYFENKNEGGEK